MPNPVVGTDPIEGMGPGRPALAGVVWYCPRRGLL